MLNSLCKQAALVFAFAGILTQPLLAKGIHKINPESMPECSPLSPPVTGGLENIIVEIYYYSDNLDSTDSDGGFLAAGSITYRIYVDMAPGYVLQALYGVTNHTCYISTTSGFFNNQDYGSALGSQINKNAIKYNTVALDSWLTLGAATTGQMGILKTSDVDGSKIGGAHNDGGSQGITGGLLVNTNSAAGTPLTTEDGLVTSTSIPELTVMNLNLSTFNSDNSGSTFTTSDGSLASMNGVQGPTSANQVLIAQLTTTGTLTFELNLQLRAPDGTIERYVASNPEANEVQFPGLSRH